MPRHIHTTDAETLLAVIREDMLARGLVADRRCEPVSVDVGGQTLRIRQWTPVEFAGWFVWLKRHPTKPDFPAEVFTRSVCTPAGEMIFEASDVAGAKRLFDREVIETVARAALDLNGLGGG